MSCFQVPKSSSYYYKREDKSGANRLRDLINEEQAEEALKGERSSDVDTEAQTEVIPEEDPEMPPIFTMHLWKRSALALLVYINAVRSII